MPSIEPWVKYNPQRIDYNPPSAADTINLLLTRENLRGAQLRNRLGVMQMMDLEDYRKAKLEDYNKRKEEGEEGEGNRLSTPPAVEGSASLPTVTPSPTLMSTYPSKFTATPEGVRIDETSTPPSTFLPNDPLGLLSPAGASPSGTPGGGYTPGARDGVSPTSPTITPDQGFAPRGGGDAYRGRGPAVDVSRVDPNQRGVIVRNNDGSFSSERTATVEYGGVYYNIPTLINGKQMKLGEAKKEFEEGRIKATGAFGTQEEAVKAARERSAGFSKEMGEKLAGRRPLTMGDIKWIEEKEDKELDRIKVIGGLIKEVGGLRRFKQLQKGLDKRFPGAGLGKIDLSDVKEEEGGAYVKQIKGKDGKPTGWSVVYHTDPVTGEDKAEVKRDVEPGEKAIQDDHRYDAIQLKKARGEPLSVEDMSFEKSYITRKTMAPMAGFGYSPGYIPESFDLWSPSQKDLWFRKYDAEGVTMALPFDYRDRASRASFMKEYADWKNKQAGSGSKLNFEKMGEAVIKGEQPPEMTNMGRFAPAVKSYLADKGYNLTQAMEDWIAIKRHLGTMNGVQQVRLRQAVEFTKHSLPIIEELAGEWKAGGFAPLNKAEIALAKKGAFGEKAMSIATRLDGQISDLVSELAVVYRGGNTSTDASLKLASQNLKSEWSEGTLMDNIGLVRRNLQIRENSIKSTRPIGSKAVEGSKFDMPVKIKTPLANIEEQLRAAGEPVGKAKEIKRDAVIRAYRNAGTTGVSDQAIIDDYNKEYGDAYGRL